MGNTLATDTIPVLITMVDVHNPKTQDQFYFCNVSSGGASTKVIGRSQTLSAEVGITTVLALTVYECPEPVFTPETARCLGILRVPIERLAERYSSGIFQQWFNLDTKTDPRAPAGDPQKLVSSFEQAYTEAVANVYQPKICLSVIGSSFEVQRGARQTFSIFVGEDVKTQAGPDLKALIASHKQQAAYIDALHEELRKVTVPSYRPLADQGKPAMQQAPMMQSQGPPMMQQGPPMMQQGPPMMQQGPPGYGSQPQAGYGQPMPPGYGQSMPPGYGQPMPPGYGQSMPPQQMPGGYSPPGSMPQMAPQHAPGNYGPPGPPMQGGMMQTMVPTPAVPSGIIPQ